MSIQFSEAAVVVTTLGSSWVIRPEPDLVLLGVGCLIAVGVLVAWVVRDGIKRHSTAPPVV